MNGTARERLEKVFIDVGTRLDKIVGPFLVKTGALRVAVNCPWHKEKTPSLMLEFHDGEDGPPSKCLSCGVTGDVIFTASDGEGKDNYAMVRRYADSEEEADGIIAIGR